MFYYPIKSSRCVSGPSCEARNSNISPSIQAGERFDASDYVFAPWLAIDIVIPKLAKYYAEPQWVAQTVYLPISD